jgi:competence protein ComEC
MIRRHLTPALAAFFPLLVSCLLPSPGALPAVCAAACCLGMSAAAIVAAESGRGRAAVLLFAAAAGLLAGAASLQRLADTSAAAFLPAAPSRITSFTASVTQDSAVSRTGSTLIRARLATATSAPAGISGAARGAVLVILDGDYRFAMGERLQVRAALAASLAGHPEAYVSFVHRPDIESRGYSSAWGERRAAAREWLHRVFERAGYPVSALMEALIIGSREEIPARLSDAFLRTGSLHILALSGLHVTLLYGLIGGALGFLRGRWARFLPATVLLLGYQVLAGFMPSLLRATVMILAAGIAWCLDRDGEPLNALALSGIVLLLVDPFQARAVSFQLSFLAMAGILVIGPLVRRPLEGRLPRWILAPLALSLGAQAATLPLVALSFGAWYPSGIVAGLLLVPLTTALLWAGLAWIPLSLVHVAFVQAAAVRALGALYQGIQWIAEFFARLPGLVPSAAALPWVAGALLAAIAAVGLALPLPRRRSGHPA